MSDTKDLARVAAEKVLTSCVHKYQITPELADQAGRIISEVIAPLEAELARVRQERDEETLRADYAKANWDRVGGKYKVAKARAEAAEHKLAEHAEAARELLEEIRVYDTNPNKKWMPVLAAAGRLRKLREGLVPVTNSPSTRGGKDGIEAAPLLSLDVTQKRRRSEPRRVKSPTQEDQGR